MSFVEVFNQLPHHRSPLLRRFEALLAPTSPSLLEARAHEAHRLTVQHFGKTMRLFAPLYLSNECVNNCKYCGFSRDNPILRTTLTLDEIEREARYLADEGFRNVLLVAGEHPKFVSSGYLEDSIRRIAPFLPSVSLEVGPMETEEYLPLVAAGAEGLVVYQETYHRDTYAAMHTAGPKRNFDWRLETPERAHAAGFRRIGIGALFGLNDWREEAIALAAHLEYLMRHCWRAQLTVSLPRLRPAAGNFQPKFELHDRDFVQLLCAIRLCFPKVGLVLSTRESSELRDRLLPLGVTMMSAGSHTEPGGYTRQGTKDLHRTVRGRRVDAEDRTEDSCAEGQFEIADQRSASEIAQLLHARGFEPVWKDWDAAILSA